MGLREKLRGRRGRCALPENAEPGYARGPIKCDDAVVRKNCRAAARQLHRARQRFGVDACGTGVVAGRNADLVHAVKSNVHANANAGRNGKRPKVTRRSRAFIIKRAARRADEPPRSGPSATHAARLWMLRHCSTFTVRHCPVERRASNVSAWRQPNDSLRSGQSGSQRIRKILDTDAALWSAEALVRADGASPSRRAKSVLIYFLDNGLGRLICCSSRTTTRLSQLVFNDMLHIRLQRFARGLREHSSNA
jgi:hypothetical protein